MLDMLLKHKKLPVIFYRLPFQQHKYRFADSVIDRYDLEVHDYAPSYVEAHDKGDEMGFLSHYQIGARTVAVGCGIKKSADGICSLAKIYKRPVGGFAFPWDLIFIGHKGSDVDPIMGEIPLNSDFVNNVGSASLSYPIRHLTDEDIWKYTEDFGLPVHTDRYIKNDAEANPDYVKACTACMERNGPNSVSCPAMGGLKVANVSSQLRWAGKLDLAHMRT